MKRVLIVILILIVFSLGFVQLANAQNFLDEAGNKIDSLKNKIEGISNGDYSSDYLKQEWSKIFEKNSLGRFLISLSDFIDKNFGPIIKIILGVPYSLSWNFIFAIFIWIGFFIFFRYPLKAFFENNLLSYIGSFVIACLVGIGGAIKFGVGLMSVFIINVWAVWLSIFILIFIILIMKKLGIDLGKVIHAEKEASEKEKLENAKKIIKKEGEIAKKDLKARGKN